MAMSSKDWGRHGLAMWAVTMAMVVAMGTEAPAGPTAAQKCEAGKNDAAGKYAACLEKAQAKFVGGGESDVDRYDAAILKCAEKYSGKWGDLESAAAGECPTTADEGAIQDFVDACVASVADALGGGTLPADPITCGSELNTCNDDLSQCEVDLASCEADPPAQPLTTGQTTCYTGGGSVVPCGATGQDGAFQAGAVRSFTDNGDGTITDNATGLMWEKLSNDGSIHDFDDTYLWVAAINTKIATLNSTAFAGYTDWRLPNRNELLTLINLEVIGPATFSVFDTGCVGGCAVTACSCTKSNRYWTSSTSAGTTSNGWAIYFNNGDTDGYSKGGDLFVRAVRGGL